MATCILEDFSVELISTIGATDIQLPPSDVRPRSSPPYLGRRHHSRWRSCGWSLPIRDRAICMTGRVAASWHRPHRRDSRSRKSIPPARVPATTSSTTAGSSGASSWARKHRPRWSPHEFWGIGYHQPPTYYLAEWTLHGGGAEAGRRGCRGWNRCSPDPTRWAPPTCRCLSCQLPYN
jgi:hypothetical protein